MKQVWSPETASKAYIDTVKSCELYQESGVAELISAMAAGWNAKLIVEIPAASDRTSASNGLSIAAGHTSGRHVIILPKDNSLSSATGTLPEILFGDPEELLRELDDIDFLLLDGHRKDFSRVLRQVRLNHRGAVLVCKNAGVKSTPPCGAALRWRAVVEGGDYQVVRSAFLPVGQGLDIAHVAASSGPGPVNSKPVKNKTRWIKRFDRSSGEEYVIRII